MLPIITESPRFHETNNRRDLALQWLSPRFESRRNIAGTRDERTNRSETEARSLTPPWALLSTVYRWWRRGAPTLHTSRKAPSCHETRPRVYAVHAVRHHSRRRRRIPGEVSTLHDGQDSRRTWKDRDIALWSYFGTRVHGFVHTYDAVRLTANRDTVRWRIAFPVEKVIKRPLAALFSMLWMHDISYISSSYLCTPFETFMQGNELF